MSRTMRDDALYFSRTGRDRFLEGHGSSLRAFEEGLALTYAKAVILGAALAEPVQRATLDFHCDHTNLNAAKNRCLGCGMWDYQFVVGR